MCSILSHEPSSVWNTPKACNIQARAGVAQLVERKALNLVVKGSSPFFGDVSILFLWLSLPLPARTLLRYC